MTKKVLSVILTLAMVLSTLPMAALAEEPENTGLCPHHTEHTEECGYVPASEGVPCGHEHTEDCWTEAVVCVHVHDERCYSGAEDAEESVEDGEPTAPEAPTEDEEPETGEPAGGAETETPDIGKPEEAEETRTFSLASGERRPDACAHVCTVESGCVTRTLDCPHEHDGACGYAEPEDGAPCGYVCGSCAAAEVQDLIGALPALEEVRAMDEDAQRAAYDQTQAAYDAYMALSEEQRALITGAGVFEEFFDFFNGQVMPLDDGLYSGGDGTEENPYKISTAEDFTTLATQVNTGTDYNGVYFKMTRDVDLSSVCVDGTSWIPIGKVNYVNNTTTTHREFNGTFDGDGHKVIGLYIEVKNKPSNTSRTQGLGIGLFGWVGKNGTVKNVGLVTNENRRGSITATIPLGDSGGSIVLEGAALGGVVACNTGTVTNCYNTLQIWQYDDSSGGRYTGGVVGDNRESGTVTSCYNTGLVRNSSECTGGVVGHNLGEGSTVANCYNTGTVEVKDYSGGVVGENKSDAIVANCYNTGKVDTSNNNYNRVGGVVYSNFNPSYPYGATVENCYYNSDVYTKDDQTPGVTGKTPAEFASGEVAWLLQNNKTVDPDDAGQVWGQALAGEGRDGFPILTGREEIKVLKVAFVTNDNPNYKVVYINPNSTVTPPAPPAAAEGYVYYGWSTTPETYTAFDESQGITENTTVYAFQQETFGGETGSIPLETIYGNEATLALSEHIGYADSTGSNVGGKFTYRITSNGGLTVAEVNERTGELTIPATAAAGNYTLKITAHEETPQIAPIALGGYGTGDVELTVAVTIAKADPTPDIPEGLRATYGQTLADVNLPANWAWDDPETTSVGNAGDQTFFATYTPTDSQNYNTVRETLTIKVDKADQSISEGEIAVTKAKESITVTNPVSAGGEEQYEYACVKAGASVGEGNWQNTAVFNGLEAGTAYMVYVRLKEDANHNASNEAERAVTTIGGDGSTTLKPGETVETDGGGSITNDGGKITIEKNAGGDTTVTPPDFDSGEGLPVNTDEGTVEVPEGGTVQTGDGPKITVGAGGGSVDMDGTVTADEIVVGETAVTAPGDGRVTADKDGTVEVPEGGTVTPPGGPDITVGDQGGTVDEGGKVKLPEGGSAAVGDTTVTVPDGGTLEPDGDGGVKVPKGTVVKPEDGPEITVGDQGGTVDEDGKVKLPSGGSATVGDTTVTVPDEGGTLEPDGDGGVILPGGSTVEGEELGDAATLGPDGELSWKVIFDSQGGSAVASATVTYGFPAPVTKPSNPAREGYTFGGWYTDKECTEGSEYDFTAPVTSSFTLYAKWTEDSSEGDDSGGDDSSGDDSGGDNSGGDNSGGDNSGGDNSGGGNTNTPSTPSTPGGSTGDDSAGGGSGSSGGTAGGGSSGGGYRGSYKGNTGSALHNKKDGEAGSATVTAPSGGNAPAPAGGFTDVSAGHTFAAAIAWAQANGVMSGYSDGSFRPSANTNRQQMWMVLARMSGANPASMAEARTWAVNAGISDGANPESAMSRQQMITMLYRFAQQQGLAVSSSGDLGAYSDSAIVADYAREALAWGVANGIINGTTDGRLNPEGTAVRAHFAAFLYRYANLNLAAASSTGSEGNVG